jgi:uncharacterized protein
MATVTTLILPGLGNSGPEHWQSHWELRDPTCLRVMQDEWDAPACDDWVERLDEEIRAAPPPVILVAHSSSCAMVAHWARMAPSDTRSKVRGALLVAPSDPSGPRYPAGPAGFAPVPALPLPFPTIVVASDNDEYVTLERATEFATAWGAMLITLRGAGHINAAAGYGEWSDGYTLLASLQQRALAVG